MVFQKKWRNFKLPGEIIPSYWANLHLFNQHLDMQMQSKDFFCKGEISDASPKNQTVFHAHIKVCLKDGSSYILQIALFDKDFISSVELDILMPCIYFCSILGVEGWGWW